MRKRNWQRIVWLPFGHPLRFKKDPFTFSINIWHSTISISNRYIIWSDLETLILDKNWIRLNTYWKMHVACFNLSTNHWTYYIVQHVHIYIFNDINHRSFIIFSIIISLEKTGIYMAIYIWLYIYINSLEIIQSVF